MIPVEDRAAIRHAYYVEHKTIRQIAREQDVARQTVRKALVAADAPPYTRLSQREFQIFQRLARGTAITVISKELSISPKSVSTYRARILEKTRCRNNAEITQYAMREGLL